MKIQTLKTANLTCTIVSGKLMQARDHKGRFVKLSLARKELDAKFSSREELYSMVAIIVFTLFMHIIFCIAISGGYAFLITLFSALVVMTIAIVFDLFQFRFSPVLHALKLI